MNNNYSGIASVFACTTLVMAWTIALMFSSRDEIVVTPGQWSEATTRCIPFDGVASVLGTTDENVVIYTCRDGSKGELKLNEITNVSNK